jgi:2-polyprenyl-3-methyl-5-hydroxy-6-metoxy-1,4-benzoquinol methylase
MIEEGHYAKKQIFCKNQIIAWSHSSRFQTTQRLLEKYTNTDSKLLDYGCGDGTFLRIISDLFSEAVGTDISRKQITDCQKRYSGVPKLSFCLTDDLNSEQYHSYFDSAVCMEVLEHCLPDNLEKVILDLKRVVKTNGLIIISVPIEIGASLVLKQTIRSVAGLLRQGDYAKSIEHHTGVEFLKMVFATKSTSIERPIYGQDSPYHGHKGFNWRSLRYELAKKLDIEQTFFSPLNWLGGFVSSQVFLICRNR